MRDILLVEPPYRNKYPPIGLMKIAAYHKMIGDRVSFIKGDINDYVIGLCVDDIMQYYIKNDLLIQSKIVLLRKNIKEYIVKGNADFLQEAVMPIPDAELQYEVIKKLQLYRAAKSQKRLNEYFYWDRIYVTTLFTFYWDITIKAIEECKNYIIDPDQLYIGGVMASLLTKEIEQETGIKPIAGLLDQPKMLDANNSIVIDDLTPDYLILDQIDYEYPAKDSYITFMTKGCTRTCSFCSVPKIEPTYRDYVPTISKMEQIKDYYGEKVNLLLMDNNVLASPKFSTIIDEIKEMGFINGAKMQRANKYEVYIRNINVGRDIESYMISIHRELNSFYSFLKEKRGEKIAGEFFAILIRYNLIERLSVTKENLLDSYTLISPLIEKYRNKGYKNRYVDFNQGTDARYVTDDLMNRMSQIPIRPLRIAFDYLGMKEQYINAIELASKYGLKSFSNYLLYNFTDKPSDLWERMKINIDLCKRLEINIFSFPMKYIPLYGEEAKGRKYIGNKWNKKFIRANQIILNVTKGIVASGDKFFDRAFGSTLNEYMSILHMPNHYIMYRDTYGKSGLLELWKKQFKELSAEDKKRVLPIIYEDEFNNIDLTGYNSNIKDFLLHYSIDHDNEFYKQEKPFIEAREKYNKLVSKDIFLDMTLTYDFDNKFLEDLGKELNYLV